MTEEMPGLSNPLKRPRTIGRRDARCDPSTKIVKNPWPNRRPGWAIYSTKQEPLPEETPALINPLQRSKTNRQRDARVEQSAKETKNPWPKWRLGWAIYKRDQEPLAEEMPGLINTLKRSRTHGKRDARVQQITPCMARETPRLSNPLVRPRANGK